MESDRDTINQGDVFWIQAEKLNPSVPGATHPHVVVQADVLNRTRIATVVVCALTSNVQQANGPGNVLLDPGEAGLPKQSVVVVSQVSTVEKAQLGAYIGTLTTTRIQQVLAGMRFQQRSFFER
jgi:mRNA interferase MazF